MTLNECRKLQLEAGELARAGWEALRAVCLRESTVEERARALAALEGAERERQILAKMEVELLACGRVTLETASDEAAPESAPTTGENALNGSDGPATARETAPAPGTPTTF